MLPWSDLVGKATEQPREPGPADGQDTIHRRLHDDLPIASITLSAVFADPPQVHAPGVVDPVKAAPTEDRGKLTQRPDVSNSAAAALPNDRVVAVRLQQVHVIGLDDDPAQRRDVKQNSIRQRQEFGGWHGRYCDGSHAGLPAHRLALRPTRWSSSPQAGSRRNRMTTGVQRGPTPGPISATEGWP